MNSHNIVIDLISALLNIIITIAYGVLCLAIVAAMIEIVCAIAPMVIFVAFITGIGTAIIRGS